MDLRPHARRSLGPAGRTGRSGGLPRIERLQLRERPSDLRGWRPFGGDLGDGILQMKKSVARQPETKPPPPSRDGVGPSSVVLPDGRWPTIAAFLIDRFPGISAEA